MACKIFWLRVNSFAKEVVVQLDQSVDRAPVAYGKVPCIVPGGRYWHSTRRRLLTAKELAKLQGLGDDELEIAGGTTLLKNLVGNSFTAPVIGGLVLGVFVALGDRQGSMG